MKVLFLDVDGVLNSTRSCIANGGYGWIGNHTSWEQLDPVAVKLIRKLCEETDCKVVLSSSWRILATQQDIVAFEKFLGVEIVGETPQKKGIRGEEIKEWIDKNSPEVYAIVDDDSDMLPEQHDVFIQTTHSDGLSFQNFLDLKTILGENHDNN